MVDVDDSTISADLQAKWLGWLGLRVGGHLALSLHSSNEPGELSQWPRHNDSTINIDIVISISISIIIIYGPTSTKPQAWKLS